MTALRMTGTTCPAPRPSRIQRAASNYDASYGRMSSGVVTALTKSGTNKFHGSTYEFNRNTDFDAGNPANVMALPPPALLSCTATCSARPLATIRRDKTFSWRWGEISRSRRTLFGSVCEFTGGTTNADKRAVTSAISARRRSRHGKMRGSATAFVVCNPTTVSVYSGRCPCKQHHYFTLDRRQPAFWGT